MEVKDRLLCIPFSIHRQTTSLDCPNYIALYRYIQRILILHSVRGCRFYEDIIIILFIPFDLLSLSTFRDWWSIGVLQNHQAISYSINVVCLPGAKPSRFEEFLDISFDKLFTYSFESLNFFLILFEFVSIRLTYLKQERDK